MACPVSLQPRVYSFIWTWCDGFFFPPTSLLSLSSQNFACCLHNFIRFVQWRQTDNQVTCPENLLTLLLLLLWPTACWGFFLKGEGRKRGIWQQSVKWDLNPCNCGYMSRQLIGWRHRDRVQSCEHTAFCSVQIQFDCELFIFFIFLRPSTNGSPPNSHLGFSCLLIQAPSLQVANVTVQLWNMAVPMACVAVSHAGTWPIVALQCWQQQIKRKKSKRKYFPLASGREKKISFLCFMHSVFLCNLCKSWY